MTTHKENEELKEISDNNYRLYLQAKIERDAVRKALEDIVYQWDGYFTDPYVRAMKWLAEHPH